MLPGKGTGGGIVTWDKAASRSLPQAGQQNRLGSARAGAVGQFWRLLCTPVGALCCPAGDPRWIWLCIPVLPRGEARGLA